MLSPSNGQTSKKEAAVKTAALFVKAQA